MHLGLWRHSADQLCVEITQTPDDVLARVGGRVSPIHPIFGAGLNEVPSNATLAVLFPSSPRRLLAQLGTARDRDRLDGAVVFTTHGLAAVIAVLPGGLNAIQWTDRWRELLNGAELWPVTDGLLRLADVNVIDYAPDLPKPHIPTLPCSDTLPPEVTIEVEHFNHNLQYFWSRAYRHAPEYEALAEALSESVVITLEAVQANLSKESGARFNKEHYSNVANLVEINSCLTMLTSQLLSSCGPIAEGSFGVGEFSLLGIGSVTRAAWRLYSHLNAKFASENHLDRIQELCGQDPFDPGHLAPFSLDVTQWGGRDIDECDAVAGEVGRQHIVYYSSRWGFHQTMNSISISWQCIQAGATFDWNLLTFSHEYLHSHLRELLDELLLDPTKSPEDLAKIFNSSAPTWRESAIQLLLSELRWIRHGQLLEQQIALGQSKARLDFPTARTTAEEVADLITNRTRVLEEIVVHIMDYIYFYDSDDAIYVSSLWHSWALVPNVQPHLHQYLLRTILALCSSWHGTDSEEAFNDSKRRLLERFDSILAAEDHGLIRQAAALLRDDGVSVALLTRFRSSFSLVAFVKRYLISKSLHTELFDDEQVNEDGEYAIRLGSFTHSPIESPYGFLLHNFRHLSAEADRESVAAQSLWQCLAIL